MTVWTTEIMTEFLFFQSFDDTSHIFSIKQGTSYFTPSQLLSIQECPCENIHTNSVVAIRIVTCSCITFGFATLSRSLQLVVVVQWRCQSKSTRLRALAVIPIHDYISAGLFQEMNMRTAQLAKIPLRTTDIN